MRVPPQAPLSFASITEQDIEAVVQDALAESKRLRDQLVAAIDLVNSNVCQFHPPSAG
jgi:hypothetical protein